MKPDEKFCINCGACQEFSNQTIESKSKNKGKGKKIAGIVLLIFGIMAVYGGTVNGSYDAMKMYGMDISDLFAILINVAVIVGGIYLIVKSKEKK